MCDFFYDHGDLADIVRASGIVPAGPAASEPVTPVGDAIWQPGPRGIVDGPVQPPAVAYAPPPPVPGLFGDPILHGGGSNLFSRVLQISPGAAGPAGRPHPPMAVDHGMQISSPCTPGIKRRKSQAKKVVCIPAPAAASNKPGGEVVPSDLWAWRKYGQKPIKGSPYPRGYYRCSSSKGCSARKQVERSRTDPNMLVITYTSEHNHPWPTQRNVLAGSTRSQPTKNGASASKNPQRTSTAMVKEEPKDTTAGATETSSSLSAIVMEEDKSTGVDEAFDRMFYNEMCEPDDFFADLAELDPDPMGLIFREKSEEGNKALDSFIDMFDWGGSSFVDQQAKKGL